MGIIYSLSDVMKENNLIFSGFLKIFFDIYVVVFIRKDCMVNIKFFQV